MTGIWLLSPLKLQFQHLDETELKNRFRDKMAGASCVLQILFLLLSQADVALIINVVFNLVVSFAATLGNLLMILCILRTPSLHSATNFLFLGLALSDVGVGLVIEPLYITVLIKVYKGVQVDCTIIAIYSIVLTFLVAISMFTITAVSVDRYLAIHCHLRYQDLVTGRSDIFPDSTVECLWPFNKHSDGWVSYLSNLRA